MPKSAARKPSPFATSAVLGVTWRNAPLYSWSALTDLASFRTMAALGVYEVDGEMVTIASWGEGTPQ